jgi:hypothetical protein
LTPRAHREVYIKLDMGLCRTGDVRPIYLHSLKRFWTPVGSNIKHDPDVDWMVDFIFADSAGRDAARRVDSTVARLPGLGWFNLMSLTARV